MIFGSALEANGSLKFGAFCINLPCH